jgi:hypothetical protein
MASPLFHPARWCVGVPYPLTCCLSSWSTKCSIANCRAVWFSRTVGRGGLQWFIQVCGRSRTSPRREPRAGGPAQHHADRGKPLAEPRRLARPRATKPGKRSVKICRVQRGLSQKSLRTPSPKLTHQSPPRQIGQRLLVCEGGWPATWHSGQGRVVCWDLRFRAMIAWVGSTSQPTNPQYRARGAR